MNPTDPNTDPTTSARAPRLIVAAGAAVAMTLAGLGVAGAQTNPTETVPDAVDGVVAPAAEPKAEGACHHGPGGRHEPLTGETAEKAKAAALEAVPGGTALRAAASDHDESEETAYHVLVRKADDTHVVVQEDKDFKVLNVTDARARAMRGPGGHHGPRPADAPANEETAA